MKRIIFLLAGVLAGTQTVSAQTPPSAPPSPAASPTTQPARKTVPVPAGYALHVIGPTQVLCTDADLQWVRTAIEAIGPTTLPTTMPAGVLDKLAQDRPSLVKQIVADFALSDAKGVEASLDESLIPQLKKLDALRPPVVYLVYARDKIRAAARAGWEYPPRFLYNRAADDVMVAGIPLTWSVDAPMDDVLVPVHCEAEESVETRQATLSRIVRTSRADVDGMISAGARLSVKQKLVKLISDQAIDPLKLRPDQEWFGRGLTAVLAIRYATQLTGGSTDRVIHDMTNEDWTTEQEHQQILRTRLLSGALDLIHPMDPSLIRAEMRGAYVDAMGRKSVRTVHRWLKEAGNEAPPKVFAALRKTPPPDGESLVKLIKDVTGIDLTKDLSPQ